jgi:hypothetical protein
MSSPIKTGFTTLLEQEFSTLQRVGRSTSLYVIRDKVRLYTHYSRAHERGATFFGLRREDLAFLEGFPSFIAFLWDEQVEPLLIPYDDFAEVFRSVEPAADGQYKVHIYVGGEGTDLQIVRAGRFGVDSYFGLSQLRAAVLRQKDQPLPLEFSHHQVQTIVGAIGKLTGHAVYIPLNDRSLLDWDVAERFDIAADLPSTGRHPPAASLALIDVLWVHPTRNLLTAAFEVEHSTTIYSGLLRFDLGWEEVPIPYLVQSVGTGFWEAFFREPRLRSRPHRRALVDLLDGLREQVL